MSLIIPVGIPGCGKSTWSLRTLSPGALRLISTDAIRDELIPNGATDYDPRLNHEVFDLFHERIEDRLMRSFEHVIADATNLDERARATLREIAARCNADTHVVIFTNVEQAIERNLKRPRTVPADAMEKMLVKYEKALRDIPLEAYNALTYISAIH